MTNSTTPTWTGMVFVDDTALAVIDTRGPGRPVVYLNGSYASQRHWRPAIAELGTDWRHHLRRAGTRRLRDGAATPGRHGSS